jgi:hypothetical protein
MIWERAANPHGRRYHVGPSIRTPSRLLSVMGHLRDGADRLGGDAMTCIADWPRTEPRSTWSSLLPTNVAPLTGIVSDLIVGLVVCGVKEKTSRKLARGRYATEESRITLRAKDLCFPNAKRWGGIMNCWRWIFSNLAKNLRLRDSFRYY